MLAVQVPAVRMIAYLRRHLDEALIWLQHPAPDQTSLPEHSMIRLHRCTVRRDRSAAQ